MLNINKKIIEFINININISFFYIQKMQLTNNIISKY